MADFEYVEWTGDTAVTSGRLTQMSENDQHVKDFAYAQPRGVLGWSQSTSDRGLQFGQVGNWYTFNGLETDIEVEEDRLIRATYHCYGVWGGHSGIKEVGSKILLDNERTFGNSRFLVWASKMNAHPVVMRIGKLTAGSHNFKVQHSVIQGSSDQGVEFRATNGQPHLLIVEDIGAYVGAS